MLKSLESIPTIPLNASDICSDVIYKDASGTLSRGERKCSFQEPIASDFDVPANCLFDGEIECLSNEQFPAIGASDAATKIAIGSKFGGILGKAERRLILPIRW